jgi:2-succinyl-5-enolpyruvyl-6-hydroxy-3-cyclohexene-1-carboxylate synthase
MNPGTKASVGLSMDPVNRTYAPLQALVDELVRCGMTHAVTCPGSRNAPLIYALAEAVGVEAVSVLDERAGGFAALGMAKASGRPVAVTCTSGTAAANLLPAVVEAREARVPLIVLTADRPPELRDTGAGQAIDQIKLYGSAAKWFVEVGSHEPGRGAAVYHRSLACRAFFTARGGRPGPVHLNFPLREPLAPVREELAAGDWAGRADSRPWVEVWEPPASGAAGIAESAARPRGAIVCGPGAGDVAEPVALLAAAAGWPVLAEPTSGVRCGGHDRSHVVAHYDVLLRDEEWAAAHVPDLVLRVGDTPTSKPLRAWLGRTEQVVIDPHATWHEPTRSAQRIAAADPALTCAELAATIDVARDDAWLAAWRDADALVAPALAGLPDPFEPKLWAALAEAIPDGALAWVSSSMPIRDVESCFPSVERAIAFLANRGANGIDGVVSSAAGAALARADRRAWLLTGELALVHDASGLLAARRAGAELTIVCANNGGGAIFDFLPLAEHGAGQTFEEHVITPSGVDLAQLAGLAGLEHRSATTPAEVREAAAAPGLVEVRTDRADNVRLHRELHARVAARLRD